MNEVISIMFASLLVIGAMASFIWLWIRSGAFLRRKNGVGALVEAGYDGNDPKHFPKWQPYKPASQ